MLGCSRGWQALGHCLVKLPLTALTAYLRVLAVVGGLYCLTCPTWWLVNPAGFGLLDPRGWGGSWYVAARPGGFVLVAVLMLSSLSSWTGR